LRKYIYERKTTYPLDKLLNWILSDNITLSTMHGCPPDEIESIVEYLIMERKLRTAVKLNPTILGRERLREIWNSSSGRSVWTWS